MLFLCLKCILEFLTNQIVSISNDQLRMRGGYSRSTLHEKRNLILDDGATFIRGFYFDMCKLLKADVFVHICDNFVSNFDYSAEKFKIVNQLYLDYYSKKLQ